MSALTFDFELNSNNKLPAECTRTFDFELKSNNQLHAECTAVHSNLGTIRITNFLLNVLYGRTFDFGHNTKNQVPVEYTAVHSTLGTIRITNYLLNVRPDFRLRCQAVTSNNLLNNQLPITCQLHTPIFQTIFPAGS